MKDTPGRPLPKRTSMALSSCTLTLSHSSLRRHVHKYTTTIHLAPPPSPPPHWNLPNPPVLPFRRLVSFPPYIPCSSLISATAPLLQDAGATATVLAGAYSLVRTFDTLTQRNLIQQSLSRKLVHILSGLLFAACWPIFRYQSLVGFLWNSTSKIESWDYLVIWVFLALTYTSVLRDVWS